MGSTHYDRAQTLPIPIAPWSTGDNPRADAVHMEVHVTGNCHGGYVGGKLDGGVTMHTGGTHVIGDPQKERKRVMTS